MFAWILGCRAWLLQEPAPEPAPAAPVAPVAEPAPPPEPRPYLQPVSFPLSAQLSAGPPVQLDLADGCLGEMGPGTQIVLLEGDDGLLIEPPLPAPSCVFEELLPYECPACSVPDCGLGYVAEEREEREEPEVDPVEAKNLALRQRLRSRLPDTARVRVRLREPGPALLYTYEIADSWVCQNGDSPSRSKLEVYPLQVTEPVELWLAIDREEDREIGVVTGASAEALRAWVSDDEAVIRRTLSEGMQQAGVLVGSVCCCPTC